jgi:hypothetical protein
MDFVHDQLVTGRRLRILNVLDDVTKVCLAPSSTRPSRESMWREN